MSINRGKESISLDLKDEAGREAFESLLAGADVLVENFRAGTMERLGYGWEALHARFPRLIYAACSGFGHTGPYAGRPAYDVVVQARGGIMSLTGHPGGPPARVGSSIGDIVAGLFTAIGVNGALYRRTLTGEGMKLDVSMLDCQVAILENALARYFASGEVPGPLGTRHPSITPFQSYATADGHVVISAGNDALFGKLCAALGRPALAEDARFADNAARIANIDALEAEFEAVLTAHPTAHWLALLEEAGVPCAPINTVEDVLADPQVAARNMVIRAQDPVAGEVRMAGNPIKLSAYADHTRTAAGAGAGRAPGGHPRRRGTMSAAASGRDHRRGAWLGRMRPWSAGVGALALLALLLAVGSCSWFALPSYDGSETVSGLDAPVEIVRDAHAIPHIYAQSPRDGAFAMGYVHAQDRLWQLEMQRRIGQARLAEVVGEPGLKTDRFLRTLGVYRVAERNVAAPLAAGAGDLRGLRGGCERLSRDPLRPAAAGVPAARPRARALAPGRQPGLAQDDGLGPRRQFQRRDAAGAPRRAAGCGAAPGPLGPASGRSPAGAGRAFARARLRRYRFRGAGRRRAGADRVRLRLQRLGALRRAHAIGQAAARQRSASAP